MKAISGMAASGLIAVMLPLLMATGCAGNKQKFAQDDESRSETVQLAITSMDSYMARIDAEESIIEQQGADASESESGVVIESNESLSIESPVDVPVITEGSFAVAGNNSNLEMAIQTGSEADKVESANTSIVIDDSQQTEADILEQPQQWVFFFDTNSSVPSLADNAALMLHAKYLQQHPDMFLMISGHADSRGTKLYNKHLSEQRAQNVADILLAAGVSPAQLRIDGLGDGTPLLDASRWQENRRVEFIYMDTLVASN